MSQTIFAERAWLPDGWARNVRLTVAAGRFVSVETGQAARPQDIRIDTALPGLVNAHSHAFQRALVARTEAPRGKEAPGPNDACDRAGEPDSFWSWRDGMYRLAARISPDALRIVARQLYAELLAGGYTSVVEFHYLFADGPTGHGTPGGEQPSDGSLPGARAMMQALADAASDVGIRLIWVPVLYAYSGFGATPPGAAQRLFVLAEKDYMAHLEEALNAEKALGGEGALFRVGAGVHSLRAVTMDMTRRVADWARRHDRPMHLHIAEQPKEVEDCVAATGHRPVTWLLGKADVDASWCLVHATHMDAAETEALARTGAVVCVCPTTEANLGDGFFQLRDWLEAGGKLAIGSDSQVGTNAYEELRWLEYGQRLATGRRNVASSSCPDRGLPAADVLFDAVLRGGYQAAGLDVMSEDERGAGSPPDGLAVGALADLAAFRGDDVRFAGHAEQMLLAALVFSATPPQPDRVMTAGRWAVVRGVCTGLSAAHRTEFARIMSELHANQSQL